MKSRRAWAFNGGAGSGAEGIAFSEVAPTLRASPGGIGVCVLLVEEEVDDDAPQSAPVHPSAITSLIERTHDGGWEHLWDQIPHSRHKTNIGVVRVATWDEPTFQPGMRPGAPKPKVVDILDTDIDSRYILSKTARRGILRRAEARGKPLPEKLALALQGKLANACVRRLTPRECLALQGFPKDYLDGVRMKGKPLSDSARYKMIGNSWCVPLVEWIFERMNDQLREQLAED